jgi:hypothetical protein
MIKEVNDFHLPLFILCERKSQSYIVITTFPLCAPFSKPEGLL